MNDLYLYELLGASIGKREGVALVTITQSPVLMPNDEWGAAKKMLVWADGRTIGGERWPPGLFEQAIANARQALERRRAKTYEYCKPGLTVEYFVESYPSPPQLVVAGAGHVARPVVQLARSVGFATTVLCDRPQYANDDQFPMADEVVCMPYLDYFGISGSVEGKYVLLLTRGHQFDVLILREIMNRSAAYVGMIGSRRRVSGVFSQLYSENPSSNFDAIYAPVGLDIGAETPEEIAISIMAEMLKVRNGGTGASMRDHIGHFIAERK